MDVIDGNVEFVHYVRDKFGIDDMYEKWRYMIKDAYLNGIELSGKFKCSPSFVRCSFNGLHISGAEFEYIGMGDGCVIENSVIESLRVGNYQVADVSLVNTVVRGWKFRYAFGRNTVERVEGCEFVDVDLKGGGEQFIGLIVDSTVSGVLRDVAFDENAQRTQCCGVDFSNLELRNCSFFGVDMNRVVPNPVWAGAIVQDWFRYVPQLREVVPLLRSSSEKADRRAGIAIDVDLRFDERRYGRPLDAQRGAKLVGALNNPKNSRGVKDRICEVYADLGVELTY